MLGMTMVLATHERLLNRQGFERAQPVSGSVRSTPGTPSRRPVRSVARIRVLSIAGGTI